MDYDNPLATSNDLAPFFRSSIFWRPDRFALSAWIEHVPFAFWLVDALRPRTIVELGTHTGVSFSAMCQAVAKLKLPTRCYAVDTWVGDDHAGYYSEEIYSELAAYLAGKYSSFSSMVRSTFDDAVKHFEDGSIDLLHIDGLHTYEAVKHDFETWHPKLSSNAIVIFHDTNVRERGFGVFRLWHEISNSHKNFEFLHCAGLGVLGIGKTYSPPLEALFKAGQQPDLTAAIRDIFAATGQGVRLAKEIRELRTEQHNLRTRRVDVTKPLRSLQKRISKWTR